MRNFVVHNMVMQQVLYQDLGQIEYGTAWDIQESLLKKGLEVKSLKFKNDVPSDVVGDTENYLLVCEHPHVYTLGKSGSEDNLLVSKDKLGDIEATYYKTNRGGDITYHGPGQIVGYPILDLEKFETDLGKYMRNLEEVIIRTLAHYGVAGDRLKGSTGVWLDPDDITKARKICAMGVRCSRWITMHGFAFNVNANLNYFNNIIPCGIDDKAVTSLDKELGHSVDMEEVKQVLLEEFCNVFAVDLVDTEVATPHNS